MFNNIALYGTFSVDYTLPDYGYPYELTGNVTITGREFTISPGLNINLQAYDISVNSFLLNK